MGAGCKAATTAAAFQHPRKELLRPLPSPEFCMLGFDDLVTALDQLTIRIQAFDDIITKAKTPAGFAVLNTTVLAVPGFVSQSFRNRAFIVPFRSINYIYRYD